VDEKGSEHTQNYISDEQYKTIHVEGTLVAVSGVWG